MHMPSLLVLVRHAQSLSNVLQPGSFAQDVTAAGQLKQFSEQTTPLTEQGVAQAKEAGRQATKLFGTFDVVYHSTYLRSLHTLEHMLSMSGVTERPIVRHHHLLRERERGYAYAMTAEESHCHFPWLEEYYQRTGFFYFRGPGGESQADVVDRVSSFLCHVLPQHAGQKVMLVTHGGTIRAFRYVLEGWTPERFLTEIDQQRVPNCSMYAYSSEAGTGNMTLVGPT